MKYLNKRFFLLVFAGGMLLGGCKKNYLDVNDDPNRVTELNITPELIFPQAEVAVGARAGSGNFTFLENWLGYTGASGSYAIDQRETSYNLDFAFSENIWQNNYNVLFDLSLVKTRALAKGDSVLAGASMILAAKLWQETVDLFGNIPYSQAFNNNSFTQPAYDDAKTIYTSLMLSLDTAKTYMGRTAKTTFKTLDVINKGDQAKWIRFANTLKLRMLIRTSEVSVFTVATEIAKIRDGGATLNIIRGGDDVTVNPGYANETNKQSPFYTTYGLTPTAADANPITRANVYFVNLLGNTDPRLQQIFAPTTGTTVTGVTYGLAAGNPVSNASSKFGPGLLKSPTQNQWIYTGFESMFLEAEAIARGWTPGNARAADSAAIVQDFIFLGLTATSAQTYIANVTSANYANAGTTALSQAKFIAYQKYIAMAGVDPQEAYSDLRRLNFLPNNGYLSANAGRIGNGGLPVRLPYPQTEYTTNSGSVNAQGKVDIFTSKIFWQP